MLSGSTLRFAPGSALTDAIDDLSSHRLMGLYVPPTVAASKIVLETRASADEPWVRWRDGYFAWNDPVNEELAGVDGYYALDGLRVRGLRALALEWSSGDVADYEPAPQGDNAYIKVMMEPA